MKNFLMTICLMVLALALCGSVRADTIYVGPGESIQAAINAAADEGDTVEVSAGTYTENLIWNDKSIWLIGAGVDVTTINGGGVGSCLVMTNVPDTARVEGFTITNGNAVYGGGMYNEDSDLTITDCAFKDNLSEEGVLSIGGGMYNSYSSPTITNCTFTGNTLLYGRGAGMHNDYSSPTVTACTFSDNTASGAGGGMDNSYSSPIVTNCTFTGNKALGNGGGGMCSSYGSNPTVTNCTFSDNSSGFSGGGMLNISSSATVTVTNCIFSGNSAVSGGGMDNSYSNSTITGCTFIGNSASWGGGMCNRWGSPTVTNCTFSGNSTSWRGGGMYNRGDYYGRCDPIITNCIMWGNTAAEEGDEIYNGEHAIPTISYSDIAGCGGDWSGHEVWGIDGGGNMDADPFFVDADGLDDIPGTEDDNLRLSFDSPCIDVGDNLAVPADVTTDLDGNPRIVNGVVDMGAYEYEAQTPADLLLQLIDYVSLLNIEHGLVNGLDAKLDAASGALEDLNENNDVGAISMLEAFIRTVETQSGDIISPEEATALITLAQEIIALL
jgi:parallel beta-helix repeat protein